MLKSKKVLISGGTGFVGSATVRALAARHPGCAITVIDRSPPRAEHILPKTIQCMQVDVTSAAEVDRAIQTVKPDIIIHTAGIVPSVVDRFSRRLEREVWKINVEGTRIMLNAALESDVEAFIYTSSCCVVTDDLSTPYCNIDEEWPTSHTSLIYGESKVVQPSNRALIRAQGIENMLTKTNRLQRRPWFSRQIAAKWPPAHSAPRFCGGRRLSAGPCPPRLHCQVPNALYHRRWAELVGCYPCEKCCRRPYPGHREPDDLAHGFRRGILHSE